MPSKNNMGPSRERQRPGWLRLKAGVGGRWLHEASGWKVEHCGVASASRPYFGTPAFPVSPEILPRLKLGMFIQPGDGEWILISSWQRGFRSLTTAQEAVEEVLALNAEESAASGEDES